MSPQLSQTEAIFNVFKLQHWHGLCTTSTPRALQGDRWVLVLGQSQHGILWFGHGKVALISFLLSLLGGDSSAPFPCAVNRSCTHPGIIQNPAPENMKIKAFFYFFPPPRFIALPPKSAALLCVFLKNCK